MVTDFLAKIFGTANQRQLKRLRPLVQHINELEPSVQKLTGEQIAAKTIEFREQIAKGRSLDDILPEAFALVRETAKRTLEQRHYDVQLIGGIVLHQGKIAEMKTGEGKTLSATLPLYLNALTGNPAYLVTVNDYLARRDAQWMAPVYEKLGLTVSALQNSMYDDERKKVYQSDIIYATNNELGFDYLRDNMKFRLEDYVQRDLSYAIVDEVDSILIDEARTPLIISGTSDASSSLYKKTDAIVRPLIIGQDYEVDEKERNVVLTEVGTDKVEEAFGIENLYAVENISLLHHTNQALRSHALFKIDVDYVVRDNEVLIVDEFTGRILPGRRYSDGLHQALEAKEGVDVKSESQTLASITLQNFFRMFKKLSGMTGTASTEAEEFHRIYKLDVISIPTNLPIIRKDESDLVFLTQNAKYKAIVEDLKERHKKGQPVLVGTVAIETSEYLSAVLTSHGIAHEVLNAKQHQREAEIVENAGMPGHITIATNMAGRGTDIKLTPESKAVGGLYILGTERHESRRIDNQLRGRAGRQGDPGESRFYISLEDDLIRRFAGDQLKSRMQWFGMKEDEVIESKQVSRIIESSQEKVEKRNFEIRKHLLEYDDVLNQQRLVVYSFRRSILEGEDSIFDLIRDLIDAAVQDIIAATAAKRKISPENYHDIILAIAKLLHIDQKELEAQEFSQVNADVLRRDLVNYVLMRYELYTSGSGREGLSQDEISDWERLMHDAQKWLLLESIDQAWKQHMVNLDSLKEGIGLRGWGQKNPLIEYKREAFHLFENMMRSVRWEIVHHIFRLDPRQFDQHAIEARRERELAQLQMTGTEDDSGSSDSAAMSREQRRRLKKRSK